MTEMNDNYMPKLSYQGCSHVVEIFLVVRKFETVLRIIHFVKVIQNNIIKQS